MVFIEVDNCLCIYYDNSFNYNQESNTCTIGCSHPFVNNLSETFIWKRYKFM
jgi:hypothetical protein